MQESEKTIKLFYPHLDNGFSLTCVPIPAYPVPKAVVSLQYATPPGMIGQKLNEERDSVERALRQNGFEITYSSYRWARDNIVYFKGNVLDSYMFSTLGTGGLVVGGKNFVLLSSHVTSTPLLTVSTALQLFSVIGPGGKTVSQELFPNAQPFFLEPMKTADGSLYSPNLHIDLSVGSIPPLNLITVDYMHYMQQREIFNALKNKGVEVRVTEPNSDEQRRLYGNNYFVAWEGREKPFVLVNKASTEVLAALEDFKDKMDITTTDRDIIIHPSGQNGGVGCMTNLSHADAISVFFKRIDFFEEDVEERLFESARSSAKLPGFGAREFASFRFIPAIAQETPEQSQALEAKMQILKEHMGALMKRKKSPVAKMFTFIGKKLGVTKQPL
ncbi:Uncharacterised protein [Candidatus Anstonella stagnisolia]|nr:Uncharacterised protein [Candidatus Anstonella stagnisolia]